MIESKEKEGNKKISIKREILKRLIVLSLIGIISASIIIFGYQLYVGIAYFITWIILWIIITPILVKKQYLTN